eukprot:1147494-Pelagomonas_calceolata.AAC.2
MHLLAAAVRGHDQLQPVFTHHHTQAMLNRHLTVEDIDEDIEAKRRASAAEAWGMSAQQQQQQVRACVVVCVCARALSDARPCPT